MFGQVASALLTFLLRDDSGESISATSAVEIHGWLSLSKIAFIYSIVWNASSSMVAIDFFTCESRHGPQAVQASGYGQCITNETSCSVWGADSAFA